MPRSYTYRNSPVLTAAVVRDEYAPLLRQGKTRAVAELPLGAAAGRYCSLTWMTMPSRG